MGVNHDAVALKKGGSNPSPSPWHRRSKTSTKIVMNAVTGAREAQKISRAEESLDLWSNGEVSFASCCSLDGELDSFSSSFVVSPRMAYVDGCLEHFSIVSDDFPLDFDDAEIDPIWVELVDLWVDFGFSLLPFLEVSSLEVFSELYARVDVVVVEEPKDGPFGNGDVSSSKEGYSRVSIVDPSSVASCSSKDSSRIYGTSPILEQASYAGDVSVHWGLLNLYGFSTMSLRIFWGK